MNNEVVDKLKRIIAEIPVLRFCVIKMLKMCAFNLYFKNPYTGDAVFINSYRHKGYWYFGRGRERRTMERFKDYIRKGDTVIEVGGHIGFVAQYFSWLVGESGKVFVFEPGLNNLLYISKNLSLNANVVLEKMAVSSSCGEAEFYEDNISGQNNSLLDNYKGADHVAKTHHEELLKTKRVVPVTSIDKYVNNKEIGCDFLKVDVEGCELNVLLGAVRTLPRVRYIMIEVTENQEQVSKLLTENGFLLEDESGARIESITRHYSGNVFGINNKKLLVV
jgi:FkbM family methyltransferase